jgi:signal peptidase I
MGDNRDNSQDSRVLDMVGFIPAENLVGRAEILFFSTNGSARIWEIWKWPFTVRYKRLFNTIE